MNDKTIYLVMDLMDLRSGNDYFFPTDKAFTVGKLRNYFNTLERTGVVTFLSDAGQVRCFKDWLKEDYLDYTYHEAGNDPFKHRLARVTLNHWYYNQRKA